MSKVLRNIFYNSGYQVLQILLSLVTIPYVSRVLGAANIGVYTYYFVLAGCFVMISKLGVVNYGNRAIAEIAHTPEKLNQRFSEIYGVQFVVSCLAILAYGIFYFFQDNWAVYLAAGLYVLSGITDIAWLYFGLEEFKKTALRSMFVRILAVALVFICVREPDDVVPYTLICCGTHLVTNLILWLMLPMVKVKLKIQYFKGAIHHLKPMLLLFLPVLGVSLYHYLNKLMLGNMAEIQELGYFQSAELIMSVPVCLITAIGVVMLPRMTSLYTKGEEKHAIKYLMSSMWLALFVVSAFAFGVMSVAPEFVALFYGPGFEPCIPLLRILMIATLFVAIANVIRTQIIIPKKMDKIYVISFFVGAAMNILLNLMLIPRYGAVGAAIATVAAEVSVFLIHTLSCVAKYSILSFMAQSVPFIMIGGAMTGLLIYLPLDFGHALNLVFKTMIGGIFYLSLSGVYYQWVLKKKLRAEISS
jgi:O-antigen/teichoic acid export membrane protein